MARVAGAVRGAAAARGAASLGGGPVSIDVALCHAYRLRTPMPFAKQELPSHLKRATTCVVPDLGRSFTVDVGWGGPADRPRLYHTFSSGWCELVKAAGFKKGNTVRVTYLPATGSYSITKAAGAPVFRILGL